MTKRPYDNFLFSQEVLEAHHKDHADRTAWERQLVARNPLPPKNTRIVLPDANGYTYYDQILPLQIGDAVTLEKTKDADRPWHQGFSGYRVFDRRQIGDTIYLMLNR